MRLHKLLSGIKYEIPPVWYEQPIYYKGNRLSFVGHKAEIKWPSFSEFLDIELEIAAIIGKKGEILKKKTRQIIFLATVF